MHLPTKKIALSALIALGLIACDSKDESADDLRNDAKVQKSEDSSLVALPDIDEDSEVCTAPPDPDELFNELISVAGSDGEYYNPELDQYSGGMALSFGDTVNDIYAGVDDYYGMSLCSELRDGNNPIFTDQAPSSSVMTAECRDFCDTFRPETVVDQATLWAQWLTWVGYIPEPFRSQLGNAIADRLRIPGAGGGVRGNLAMCVPNVLGYLSAEIHDQNACRRGSNCVACGSAGRSRTACRVFDAIRTCAQMAGVRIPWSPVGVLARTCGAGTCLQKESYRYICKDACINSLEAALPIAPPVVDEDSDVTRRCCSCDRHIYENTSSLPGGDDLIEINTYNSVTSDTDQPTRDCEGKNGTYHYPAGATGPNGYAIYYYYDNCHKYQSADGQCHADSNSYHPGGEVLQLEEEMAP